MIQQNVECYILITVLFSCIAVIGCHNINTNLISIAVLKIFVCIGLFEFTSLLTYSIGWYQSYFQSFIYFMA